MIQDVLLNSSVGNKVSKNRFEKKTLFQQIRREFDLFFFFLRFSFSSRIFGGSCYSLHLWTVSSLNSFKVLVVVFATNLQEIVMFTNVPNVFWRTETTLKSFPKTESKLLFLQRSIKALTRIILICVLFLSNDLGLH